MPISYQPPEDKTALGLAANPQRNIYLILHQIKVPVRNKTLAETSG